jgi:MOSC domain-containing protein YiiM
VSAATARGTLLSVNVGLPRPVAYGDRTVVTAIFKEAVAGPVALGRSNLAGDGQADLRNHGGEAKAVYAFAHENYAAWQRELGRDDFRFGQFGENFTLRGWLDDEVHVGDVFEVGGARVEVTQPRAPCFKLGIRMGSPGFPKRFLAGCRVGFYLRVLAEGEVRAGDAFERVTVGPEAVSVREACHLLHFDTANAAGMRRALRVPALSPAWREAFEERLARIGGVD